MGKRKKQRDLPIYEIDLHGLTLSAALTRLDTRMVQLEAAGPRELIVKVITGKGLHSGPDGSVLPREVHGHFAARYRRHIVSIEESPHAVALSGLPIRGHFTAKLRFAP